MEKPTPQETTQRRELQNDLFELILEDHRPLLELIQVLKDTGKDTQERQRAFSAFAVELVAHAKPEEQVLYMAMKKMEELRELGFEGDVEHGVADQLLEEARRTTDPDEWSARVKVLAELVEHHIEEEEKELLPSFRKNFTGDVREAMGEDFLRLKTALLSEGGEDAPSEQDIQADRRRPH